MKDTEKVLKEELSKHFAGHSQRLSMLSKLIISLIKMGTVNYSKLSLVLNPLVDKLSNFKRIQRFMKEYVFAKKPFVNLVWQLLIPEEEWVILAMDRTNWKFGKCNINILMIGISFRGTLIPLLWHLLDKRGNSSQKERESIISELMELLDTEQKSRIRCLLADREFIGNEWIGYLKKLPFAFYIRVKKNTLISKGKEKGVRAERIFSSDRFLSLRKKRRIFGQDLFIGGQRAGKNDWFIIISNVSVYKSKEYYAERWGIEVFFGACKKRGFNFEDTHVTDRKRLSNLIFILSIAFCWALKTGLWLIENGKKITIKNLGNRKAKLISIFSLGLERLRIKLLNFLSTYQEIFILSCT